jgi:hypothetical protein
MTNETTGAKSMKEIATRTTAKRIYWVNQDGFTGLFHAAFQPINQKTGKPWQAMHRINGADAYELHNTETKESTGVVVGKLPAFSDPIWQKLGSGDTGFSTAALAIAAMEKAISEE